MTWAMTRAAVVLIGVSVLLSGQAKQRTLTLTGVITDSECAAGDHSLMKMGPNDRECTIACVHIHGSQYVLYDGRSVYELAKQEQGEQFAGQRVTVVGSMRDKLLEVRSIRAAK